MLNFTLGPVNSDDEIYRINGNPIPYFRTDEFSSIMKENEELMLELCDAPVGSNAVFLTNSSTGAMEASVINCLSNDDKVIVIDGGDFGHRFVELCEINNIKHDVIKLEYGTALLKEKLYEYDNKGYTALLVNITETSTGIVYDASMIGEFCKKNNIFFICDCVSSFLTEVFSMDKYGADVMITGSQKALACAPGVSIIILSTRAIERAKRINPKVLYLNINSMLINMERGQTPFTPAVNVLLQLNFRLKRIRENGGVLKEIDIVKERAFYFRKEIDGLPLDIFPQKPANALTAIHPIYGNAYEICIELKENYGIWVCPNGGKLKNEIFRVGHIGAINKDDSNALIDAIKDLYKRGKFR